MDGHRLVRKPKNFRGKVRGGHAVGCECNAMTLVADVKAAIRWHAGHLRDVEQQAREATPLGRAQAIVTRSAQLRERAAALSGG